MCRPLELVFANGMDQGEMVGIPTGDVTQMATFDEFYDAYRKQMEYCISLLVNADNAIDVAHAKRCPLPFLSSMIDDCIKRGKTVQEGGAVYNFTGPQGFGIANMADSLYAIRQLVYEEKKFTMEELKEALAWNYGKGLDEQSVKEITTGILREMTESGAKVDADTAAAVLKSVMNAQMAPEKMARYQEIHDMIAEVPKFGMIFRKWTTSQEMWLTHIQDRFRTLRTTWWTVPGRTLSGFCKRTPWRTDWCYTRWKICTYSGCRWCFPIRRQGCERTYCSSKLCCETGSLYRIQWYFVQSEIPSVSIVWT